MSGKSLQDLGLRDEELPTAGQLLDELPEFGARTPLPQPGSFRLRLPKDLSQCWAVIDVTKNGKEEQRVKLLFDKDNPLLIVQSVGNRYDGQPLETNLTNNERARGNSGVVASDLHYLVKAMGEKTVPKTNAAWVRLINGFGGREFGADWQYSWQCSENRDIYVPDGQGGTQKVEGRKGCGWRYYMGDSQPNPTKKVGYIQRPAGGDVPTDIQCQCGAQVRAFGNLDNIRA